MGEFTLFFASSLVYQFSRFVVGLIVARWVGPEEFGVWNTLNLLLLYGAFASLGVLNGMNREIPLLRGRRGEKEAAQIVILSFWFMLFSSIVIGLIISFIAISSRITEQFRQSLMWMGLLFISHYMYLYFQLLLKSNIKFRLMSIQQFMYAIVLPLVVLPMASQWHIPGFILGQAIVALALGIFICRVISFKPAFFWSWSALFFLIKIGFPIMVAGVLYGLLTSVDRWIILTFLGVESLGYYSLAIICLGTLGIIPSVVSQQLYPRMAFRYGQTSVQKSLFPMVIRQSLMSMVITVPILILVYFGLPFLVTYFLPEYSLGLVPARILLIGLAFIPLAGGVGNFLNIVDKQIHYMAIIAFAVIINLGLDLLFVKLGWGLNGVALGSSITYVIYVFVLWIVGLINIAKEKSSRDFRQDEI